MYSSDLGVQLPLAAVLQQAHEPGHHPQRLLQVVRGHVGKLLQVLVRAGQVFGGLPQRFFGQLALGDLRLELRVGPFEPGGALFDQLLKVLTIPCARLRFGLACAP